jgi:hypothetical protein
LKRVLFTVVFIGCCVLGLTVGYFVGSLTAFHKAWNDEVNAALQIYRANLLSRNLEPQLQEFLKERLYCLTARIDRGAIQYSDIDFGPVDYTVLGTAIPCADGTWRGRTYKLAMEKHSLTKPVWPYKKP